MYVCGMTVYDHCHIGHARLMVVFDTVYRHLLARGYDVTYVRNITDIDDKIIDRANANNEPFSDLANRFIDAMHEDEASLGIAPPTHEPRATETIDGMLTMISSLVDKGHAYHVEGGDVYYAVGSFPQYGKLSGRNLDDMRAGERVAIDEHKRDPADFVLWKSVKPNEPHWDSPWGPGRPGWHIECSAMAENLLGETFDIHGGGLDLQFPHHENEIAQSEAAHDCAFANYWMHNGLVRLDDEKMSKSLGNFFTVRDILQNYSGEELRFFYNSSHYRSPINYSEAQLQQARTSLRRLYTALRGHELGNVTGDPEWNPPAATVSWVDRFNAEMDDDFNTAGAMAVMFELASEINRQQQQNPEMSADCAATLVHLGQRLGILGQDAEAYLKGGTGNDGALDDSAIEALIEERLLARGASDWARSDAIRDQLKAEGVILEDKAGQTTWRRE